LHILYCIAYIELYSHSILAITLILAKTGGVPIGNEGSMVVVGSMMPSHEYVKTSARGLNYSSTSTPLQQGAVLKQPRLVSQPAGKSDAEDRAKHFRSP
jgi:hypothetical protein